MYFWKIDEESIYCLINASEIRDMGYDIKELSGSHDLMGKFLEEIVRDSFKYVNWNTDNGIQTYVARALPAGQFLLTISCTFIDVAIDRDLDQIRAMTEAINRKISADRIEEIYLMKGEEKEKAFEALARDLHAICTGEDTEIEEDPYQEQTELSSYQDQPDPDMSSGQSHEASGAMTAWKQPDQERPAPAAGKERGSRSSGSRKADQRDKKAGSSPGVYLFRQQKLENITDFCASLGRNFHLPSVLYRSGSDYVLEVAFPPDMRKDQVLYCVMAGEEYGARVKVDKYESNYLKEHGTRLIGEDAISVLQSLK